MRILPPPNYEKETQALFPGLMDPAEYSRRFNSLGEETRGRFVRACFIFQKAVKLKASEPSVSMSLLCSAVEATLDGSSSLIFKDWLVTKRLDKLSEKTKDKVKVALNDLYKEYISTEEEREGASYNFKRFLLTNCPKELMNPPMIVHPGCKAPSRAATFEESLSYIYSKFRSLFVHRGIGRLDSSPFKGTLVSSSLLDVHGSDCFRIDTLKVLDWFTNVVLDSIWGWFSTIKV